MSAPVRLFIFSDRIEIVSPGHLPDNVTVEKIRAGNSNIRNPIVASYVAKGLMLYRGLGSGIKRALSAWSDIALVDNRDGNTFTATVLRHVEEKRSVVRETVRQRSAPSEKTSEKILIAVREDPKVTIQELARRIGVTTRTIERSIQTLQHERRLRRLGPDKGGRWQARA